MKFQSITLSAIGLALALPALTSPLLGLLPNLPLSLPVVPVLTPGVVTLPVVTPPDLKKRVQVPVTLGTAATFGVLGASTVTSTGNTVITGDIGVFPGSAITGFPPGVYSGKRYNAGAVAGKAQDDSTTAYNTAMGLTPTMGLATSDLGGRTLSPGVYTFPSSTVELTTNLTLDAGGDPTAQFVFQIMGTFQALAFSNVLLVNSATPCNVIFAVSVSAMLEEQTAFQGILLVEQGIAVKIGVSNIGSFISLVAAVTLIDNNLKSSPCVSGPGGGGGTTSSGVVGGGGTTSSGVVGGGGGTTQTTSVHPSTTSVHPSTTSVHPSTTSVHPSVTSVHSSHTPIFPILPILSLSLSLHL